MAGFHVCRLHVGCVSMDDRDDRDDRDPYFFVPGWPVLYEDNHLLALYKPSGLLVQGDQTGDISLLDLAKIWIKERYGKPGQVFLAMVHRLDRPVAGVILFCRTSKAAARISTQFRARSVKKNYVAVLEGVLETSGVLVHDMERIRGASSRITAGVTNESREARLSFRVLETSGSNTMVSIDLETGRHHQIRAQFAHIGHPVMGDLRYGASRPLPEKQIALFARSLTVLHPITGKRICLECPLPSGWPWPGMVDKSVSLTWDWQTLSSS